MSVFQVIMIVIGSVLGFLALCGVGMLIYDEIEYGKKK